MKLLNYILIVSLFFIQPICFAQANGSQSPSSETTSVEQKQLTDEEIHQQKQAELDKKIVEKVSEIRGRLKTFVKFVHKYSPETADILVVKFLGIRVIQYAISLLILIVAFSLTKYVISFLFKSLLSNISKKHKNSFAVLFISKIRLPINVVAWVVAIYYMVAFLIKDPHIIAIMARLGLWLLGYDDCKRFFIRFY